VRFGGAAVLSGIRAKRAPPLLQHETQNMNTTENHLSTEKAIAPESLKTFIHIPNAPAKPVRFTDQPHEYKVISLRECPTPEKLQLCDTPAIAAAYWRNHIAKNAHFNPECECLAVLILNTRRRIKGHYLVSIGTIDTLLCHAREIFRLAIMASAHSLIIGHNHPSGDPTPSDADIRITRDLVRAGRLLKIEILDHLVIGQPNHCSLKELGHIQA
jgi:hypothetical protein